MAEAVLDDHPLQQYLEETIDQFYLLPGAYSISDDEFDLNFSWLPPIVLHSFETAQHWTSRIREAFPTAHNDFAERFKYDLISSTLLSSSVPATPVLTQSRLRPPSPDASLPGELNLPQEDTPTKSDKELKSFSGVFAILGLTALLLQHRLWSFLSFVASWALLRAANADKATVQHLAPICQSLDQLKEAGSAWDAAINEAMAGLEYEERGSPYSSSSSSASSSPSALRVALHSTLLTTQTQCDNVRPLLAALACPVELAQLSEMYAPPSPAKQPFALLPEPSSSSRRPISLSESAAYTPKLSIPPSSNEKRQTWNGSYMSLASFQPINTPLMRKRNWRRSDMSSLMEGQSKVLTPPRTDPDARTSPTTSSSLPSLQEADDEDCGHENDEDAESAELVSTQDNFGTAALYLRRKRRARGASALGLPSSRSSPTLRSPRVSPSLSSSSKFTTLQPARNPLSLSALHHSLDGAVAARRYACAHLLALRFSEDAEDETYWENVRSVMSLLTSTLEDATARLSAALSDSDQQRSQMGQPSPFHSPTPSVDHIDRSMLQVDGGSGIIQSPNGLRLNVPTHTSLPLSPLGVESFAPMPSELSRFGSHVDALSAALDDARDQLQQTVRKLQEESSSNPISSPLDKSSTSEQAALDHIDMLRRVLGLALRECERGRTALVEHFENRRRQANAVVADSEGEDDVTMVAHDEGSGSSCDFEDRQDLGPITPDEGSPILPSMNSVLFTVSDSNPGSTERQDVDDVTRHLLNTASPLHLPPPGIEQVFESDSVVISPFTRERSKATREERIKAMKERRQSMQTPSKLPVSSNGAKRSRFSSIGLGPGLDVVDELKDVIWKVGERRRKLGAVNANTDPRSNPDVQLKTSMRLF